MIPVRVRLGDIVALFCFLFMLGSEGLAMAAMIEGLAKDTRGQPLQGVHLTLRATTGRIAGETSSTTDGHYRFGGIAAGNYWIAGVKSGFAAATPVDSTDQSRPKSNG